MFKKINSAISYYKKPSLKTKNPIMAISVDKSTINKKTKLGIAREIIKRKGHPTKTKFLDKSKLVIVESKDLLNWKKKKDLEIKNIEKIISNLSSKDKFFIGLEDPDLFKRFRKTHLFFTIAFKLKNKKGYEVYLGHAKGKNLDNLKATKPFLKPNLKKLKKFPGFKEISILPSQKFAFAETGKGSTGTKIAFVKIKSWTKKFKETKIILDPNKIKYKWCNGELSTAPIIKKIKINNKKYILSLFNGRGKKKNSKIHGTFSIGLFLFNKKTKNIDWISPKPLIKDPKAKGITFASDLIHLNKNTALLYAHIDDTFIRCYKINLKELKKLLPKKI